jgi:hypothetical protein
MDEVAFWRDENSSQPDVEAYRALLPSLATTNGMIIGISSPYNKRGLLYQKHRDFYGVGDPDTLILAAGTSVFNPTIDQSIIDQAMREDPEAAQAEWMGTFAPTSTKACYVSVSILAFGIVGSSIAGATSPSQIARPACGTVSVWR